MGATQRLGQLSQSGRHAMKRLIAAAALVLLATAAHAGDNSCFGLLVVGPQFGTAIHTGANNSPPNSNVCRFKTASPLGQRILRVCPNGSECLIEMPLPAMASCQPHHPSKPSRASRTSKQANDRPRIFCSYRAARRHHSDDAGQTWPRQTSAPSTAATAGRSAAAPSTAKARARFTTAMGAPSAETNTRGGSTVYDSLPIEEGASEQTAKFDRWRPSPRTLTKRRAGRGRPAGGFPARSNSWIGRRRIPASIP